MLRPDLLLLSVPLGQRELPLLLGHQPLLAWLVGLRVGGEVVPELATCHNLGWAAANVPERSVPVVKQGSGKLVIVQTARLVSVVPDQLLC